MTSPAQELLERTLARLPEDEPGAEFGPEWSDAENEVVAVKLLSSMLVAHKPAKVLEGLKIAFRLLQECRSPESAADRLGAWRRWRLDDDRPLTPVERGALTVAGVISGDLP